MNAAVAASRTRFALRPLFIMVVLLGSFLLFLIQPLVGRLVLPVLGGSPSVWNSAMLFYQAALLCGYAYAHALQRLAREAFVPAQMEVGIIGWSDGFASVLPVLKPFWHGFM